MGRETAGKDRERSRERLACAHLRTSPVRSCVGVWVDVCAGKVSGVHVCGWDCVWVRAWDCSCVWGHTAGSGWGLDDTVLHPHHTFTPKMQAPPLQPLRVLASPRDWHLNPGDPSAEGL